MNYNKDHRGALLLKIFVSMVLVLDGNTEIGTHVKRNLEYLICLRHLIRSKVVTNRLLFLRVYIFFFMRAQIDLCYHLV